MRVALLNPTVLLRRPIAQLAHQLGSRGHDVTIITSTDKRSAWAPAHFEDQTIKTMALPSFEIRSVLWSVPWPSAYRRLWKAMKEFEIIHIWAPYYIQAILPLIYRLFLRYPKPKIVLTFDTFPAYSFTFDSMLDLLMRWYHQTVGRWLFSRADRITLYGRQLLPYANKLHLPAQKISVLSTGVDLQPATLFRPIHGAAQLLFIGLMNRRKGVHILLDALASLKEKKIDFLATLVGDGPDRQYFETLSRDLGLTEVVRFLGRQKNVADLYRQADFFVLPSYGEGLPGVVMEAMTYGVPVVATDIPCLRELIPDDQTGLLVPAGNAPALAAAIQTMIADENYRRRASAASLQHITQFSWSSIVSRYEQVYATA